MSQRKHPDQRHGHRSAAENAHDTITPQSVAWPDPDPSWHEAAADWYLSLAQSAQADTYQQSDAATAYVVAENLSRHLASDGPMNGNAMGAFLTACEQLLASAGSRRRLKLEMSRPDSVNERAHLSAVSSIADRRPSDGA